METLKIYCQNVTLGDLFSNLLQDLNSTLVSGAALCFTLEQNSWHFLVPGIDISVNKHTQRAKLLWPQVLDLQKIEGELKVMSRVKDLIEWCN